MWGGGDQALGALQEKGPEVSQSPKTTYKTIEIAEKQPKRSKKGPFRYMLGPPGSHPETGINGARGEGPSRYPRFLQP